MIRFEDVTKRFGGGQPAVEHLDLEIADGELTVLVGPSGCGKTTSLRMINRLEELSAGSIRVDGRDVMGMDRTTLRRGIGYVMQSSGLFPHRTIRRNIATVPRLLGWDDERTEARVRELAELLGLGTELLDRYPHALSGGQQQRVGVARALAADPPILLMDEPFAAVDPIVRARLQDELVRLQRRLHKTIVFVTHDIEEAIKLGDRIAVLREPGRVAQYARPAELLAHPADDFVADFLGNDRALRRLGLAEVDDIEPESAPTVGPHESGRVARATAEHHERDWCLVVEPSGEIHGWRYVRGLDDEPVGAGVDGTFRQVLSGRDSLRSALNAVVNSEIGVAPCVDEAGRYTGVISHASLHRTVA